MKKVLIIACMGLLAACGDNEPQEASAAAEAAPAIQADIIYTGGTVLTVDQDNATASAVAVKDGRILGRDGRSVFTIERPHSTRRGWHR